MTIHSILKEFADATELPAAAISESLARKGEAVPVFLSLMERASDSQNFSDEEERALVLVVHILGEIGEKRAFRPLLKFLASDQDRVDRLLGDVITETLPQILISVFDGDVAPLLQVMNNDELDEFVRDGAFRAWTYLANAGMIDRDEAHRFLQECYTSLRPATESHVWISWADAVTRLRFGDLMPLVRSAYDDRRILHDIMDFDDFESELAEAADPDLRPELMIRSGLFPFVDTVGRLSDWHFYGAEESDLDDLVDVYLPPIYTETVTNPFRHIGRNDPCPCGSGQKFKKCCLEVTTA